jgi:hypothetical protein
MTTITIQDVVGFIDQASEAEVRSVFALCQQRTKSLRAAASAMNLSTLKKGDTVVLNGISPKYLNGEKATVVNVQGRKAGRVSVQLDHTVGRFSSLFPIEVPASTLTLA